MFALKIFRGPRPSLGCALANLGEYLVRRGRNMVSRKSQFGGPNSLSQHRRRNRVGRIGQVLHGFRDRRVVLVGNFSD